MKQATSHTTFTEILSRLDNFVGIVAFRNNGVVNNHGLPHISNFKDTETCLG
jgi:hypothetical protein